MIVCMVLATVLFVVFILLYMGAADEVRGNQKDSD